MKSLSILLVEDNPDDVQLMREAFMSVSGAIEVKVAASVVEAISLLATKPTPTELHLAVIDHYLPDGNGQEVAKQVRSCSYYAHLPIVMVSGDVIQPHDLGDITWYSKPITWDEWRALASTLIGRVWAVN
jgi:CheY-like chemotaxis protein